LLGHRPRGRLERPAAGVHRHPARHPAAGPGGGRPGHRHADLRPTHTPRPHPLVRAPGGAPRATGMRTSAILATHTYGTPCDVESLSRVAKRNGGRLFFDPAHAFASRPGPP